MMCWMLIIGALIIVAVLWLSSIIGEPIDRDMDGY